jgi:5-methylcytosine-specific restriction endonuclease McrA
MKIERYKLKRIEVIEGNELKFSKNAVQVTTSLQEGGTILRIYIIEEKEVVEEKPVEKQIVRMPHINIAELREKAARHKNMTTRAVANRKLNILIRDKFKCVRCGADTKLTIDHIKPQRLKKNQRVHKSGWRLDECQTLCVDCHLKKNEVDSRSDLVQRRKELHG